MIITNEILAAYVDGTLPQDQIEEVRLYLASHPKELEQVIALMDRNKLRVSSQKKQASQSTSHMGSTLFSCSAKAAKIAPNERILGSKKNTTIMENLDSLLNEIL